MTIGRVVIVGTGQAGIQVAASLREGGFAGAITLVGEESATPYQRPPLSKAFLQGSADVESLLLRASGFFEAHGIEMRAGVRAEGIERRDARLRLGSGESLAYDHLVLATGSRNRALPIPGADLKGVLQLRTLADAAILRDRLSRARRVCIVGAGFIGLEVAALAAGWPLEVTLVEATERPMSQTVSVPMSAFFRGVQDRSGIRSLYGMSVARVTGQGGHATGVETAEGHRIRADVVLAGIGVDETLATDDAAISAIGDCANHPSRFSGGRRVRVESVQNAIDQARCVAARLLGRPAPYAALPWFWSDQGPYRLQIAGLATPHDRVAVRGDPPSGAFSVFCFAGTRLAGVESVNRLSEHMAARRLVGRSVAITLEEASDPGFDLKAHASE